jgi:hypothetical protein
VVGAGSGGAERRDRNRSRSDDTKDKLRLIIIEKRLRPSTYPVTDLSTHEADK